MPWPADNRALHRSPPNLCANARWSPADACCSPFTAPAATPICSSAGDRLPQGQPHHDTYLSACSASSRDVNLASRNSACTSSTSPRATSSRPARQHSTHGEPRCLQAWRPGMLGSISPVCHQMILGQQRASNGQCAHACGTLRRSTVQNIQLA